MMQNKYATGNTLATKTYATIKIIQKMLYNLPYKTRETA